jgi:GntR family transcriptional repressor for pyruvate dehydrogenase complex
MASILEGAVFMVSRYSEEELRGLEPLRTVNTNEVIQERLLQYIKRQGLVAGDRLPSQQALAERFEVSLVALREALRSLEALGILEVKVGAGWFVKAFSFDAIAKGLFHTMEFNEDTLRDLHEIRMYLECSFVVHATRTLSPEDIDELEELGDEMIARASAGKSWHELDHCFHQKLYSAIRNQVFNKLMEVFWALYSYIGAEIAPEESLTEALKHRPIVEAIRAGDEERAAEMLRESLQGSRKRLSFVFKNLTMNPE